MESNSLGTGSQDCDKSLFDAEQFLTNFTNLRDECERLKNENHELQLRVQQLSQDHGQLQIDKQNLERHIQKETLRHKEVIWNLKMEVQKSQEERLSWKEKFLDLCIKSSQNGLHNMNQNTEVCALEKDKKRKKGKGRKAYRKKIKSELSSDQSDCLVSTEVGEQGLSQDSLEFQQDKQVDLVASGLVSDTQGELSEVPQVELNQNVDNENHTPNMQDHVVVEGLGLDTNLSEEGSIGAVGLGNSVDTKFSPSPDLGQSHVVTTDTGDFYSIQPAQFNIDTHGQPVSVSGNTTTFILQTSDATFCATAVMDDQQRTHFNTAIPFEIKETSNSFENQATFSHAITKYNSDSESDENTEFNYRCSMCNFTYSEQSDLDKHIKAKHSAKTNFCKECGKAYSTKASLAQHVHHYHRHPMAYHCEICEKKFNRKDFLIKHIKTHTQERAFPCTHCDKQFKTSTSLSAHVNGSHNDKRRFVCDFCGMRTSWRLSYLEHMKLHTGEPRKAGKKKKEELQADPNTHAQLAHNLHLVKPQDELQLVKGPDELQLVKSSNNLQLVKTHDNLHDNLTVVKTPDNLTLQGTIQGTVVQFITGNG